MPIYTQSSTLRNLTIPLTVIDYETLSQDQVLQYNATTGKFENQSLSISNSDFITTASNLGGGEIVFAQETGTELQFKTLVAGAGMTLTSTGNEITIGTTGASVTGSNIGTGFNIFAGKIGLDLQFRSLNTGTGNINFSFANNGDTLELTNLAEINTASNLGAGEGVFAQKSTYDLEFKSLVAGDNINISSDANEITISANANTGFTFQFTVNFDSNGDVAGVNDLPTGWLSSITGNVITITHNFGEWPKNISYWGLDSVNGWQLRYPTGGYQATIASGEETTKFKINVNSVTAGADVNSQAKVNVIF